MTDLTRPVRGYPALIERDIRSLRKVIGCYPMPCRAKPKQSVPNGTLTYQTKTYLVTPRHTGPNPARPTCGPYHVVPDPVIPPKPTRASSEELPRRAMPPQSCHGAA